MEIREIQLRLLSVMKKLHVYCVEHDIRYCMSYGTLLGAVRHKGFIPWDDDIDVIMPREDCHRLLELAKTTPLASDVGILHHSIDKAYHYNMIRAYDKNTVVSMPHVRTYPEGTGLWVDILPLDAYNPSLRYAPTRIALELTKKLQSGDLYALPGQRGAKQRVKQLIHALLPNKDNQIARRIDRLAMSVPLESTDYYTDAFERGKVHIVTKKTTFDELILLDFEDARFFAPRDPVAMLEYEYGPTWTEPPPPEERIPAHNITVQALSK
jgi:lipopolysaccharide cholinephosphotransferase